jgi:beta-galactosidase/beta-glucuronidase
LPAEYPLVRLTGQGSAAEAIVTDPCAWSAELPHLYRVEVEATRGNAVVATYHGELGLRRTSEPKNWDHIK